MHQALVESLPREIGVADALERFCHLPYCCLLDSALAMPKLGRYSFLAADPFEVFQVARPQADPLAGLSLALDRYQTETMTDLPPFQGGAAGVFGYEFGRCFERVPAAHHNEFGLPLGVLGLYDVVVAWDHASGQAWLISQGFPETDPNARARRAANRLQFFRQLLVNRPNARVYHALDPHATAHGLTAPQFETRIGKAWLGNFDSRGFRAAVDRAREYIYAGDLFQVNLAQRLLRRAACNSIDLYLRLRDINAAPFAGYFDLGSAQIISASPERFLQVRDRQVETRPIKGTRRRAGIAAEDERLGQELLASTKDLAENTMIVDLLRNDLSRVCDPTSLRVTQFCDLETYTYVHHMVSAVEGRLRDNATWSDLIAAAFPGGSVTGAPKVRAMEIVAELEPTVRGPYCGSLGYVGFDGSLDLNILIRTITASLGWWQLQVGGGIVADSKSESEEEETWIKAKGLVDAIELSAKSAIKPLVMG